MELILFLVSLICALVASNRTGVATIYMINKLAHYDAGENPTYLMGHLCGLFFGVYGYFLPAIFGGPYGFLWGVLVAAISFPVFAFSIVAYVRVREALEDWRKGESFSG